MNLLGTLAFLLTVLVLTLSEGPGFPTSVIIGAEPPVLRFPLTVLTPASIVRVLAAGYPVEIHPSAFRGAER